MLLLLLLLLVSSCCQHAAAPKGLPHFSHAPCELARVIFIYFVFAQPWVSVSVGVCVCGCLCVCKCACVCSEHVFHFPFLCPHCENFVGTSASCWCCLLWYAKSVAVAIAISFCFTSFCLQFTTCFTACCNLLHACSCSCLNNWLVYAAWQQQVN